ncbi:hypothetical protein AgCh_039674 [Apium graveolens]
MQIWTKAQIDEQRGTIFFGYDKEYKIIAEGVEKALSLPILGDRTNVVTPTATLFQFVRSVGHNTSLTKALDEEKKKKERAYRSKMISDLDFDDETLLVFKLQPIEVTSDVTADVEKESEVVKAPVIQEQLSQSESADTTSQRTIPDIAQGGSDSVITDITTHVPQEPSVKSTCEDQPSIPDFKPIPDSAHPDHDASNPDSSYPDPDLNIVAQKKNTEVILVTHISALPLESASQGTYRDVVHSPSKATQMLKSRAEKPIPDADLNFPPVTGDDGDNDDSDDDDPEAQILRTFLEASKHSSFGSSSRHASAPDTPFLIHHRSHEWSNSWSPDNNGSNQGTDISDIVVRTQSPKPKEDEVITVNPEDAKSFQILLNRTNQYLTGNQYLYWKSGLKDISTYIIRR